MEIAPDVFWRMTLAEYFLKAYGFSERQKNELRRFRWLGTLIRRSLGGKESEHQLMPIDGDAAKGAHDDQVKYVREQKDRIKNIYKNIIRP